MKGKLLVMLVLVLLFVGFIIVRYYVIDKQNEFGKLKIISSPGTSVFINNAMIGKTPFEDKYKVGEYLLKLIPDGTSTETASWNGKINVYKNALTYVNRDLGSSDLTSSGEIFTTQKLASPPKNGNQGEIYVETEPQGAIVTMDNDEKGVAPLILTDVLKGDHEISVFMPGFFRRTQKVNVDPGYRVNAAFKLASDPSSAKTILSETKKATDSATAKKTYVRISDNPQGWLRVRADANVDATEEAKIKTGGKYEYLDTKSNWYKIAFNGDESSLVSGEFKEGWVSSEYSAKVEE